MESTTLKKKYNKKEPDLIVMASGTGTLFINIVQACKNNSLNARVINLVTDNPRAVVIQKAQKEQVPVNIFSLKAFPSFSKWDTALCQHLKTKKPDLILLAGFLKKIGPRVLSHFKNRIINIHPSLLPRHGGDGMYGIHVHRSVLKAGDKKTGVSIHLVSEEYDRGPILAQTEVPVSPNDTPESLQEKVKKTEQVFYVSTLRKIFHNKINLRDFSSPL